MCQCIKLMSCPAVEFPCHACNQRGVHQPSAAWISAAGYPSTVSLIARHTNLVAGAQDAGCWRIAARDAAAQLFAPTAPSLSVLAALRADRPPLSHVARGHTSRPPGQKTSCWICLRSQASPLQQMSPARSRQKQHSMSRGSRPAAARWGSAVVPAAGTGTGISSLKHSESHVGPPRAGMYALGSYSFICDTLRSG